MRKRIYVILLCVFFFVVFIRSNTLAQTTGFSKISPGWNQTLWTSNYSYQWTFTWKPYNGGTPFDYYLIKFFNNSGTMVKQLSTSSSNTSLLVDFTNMTEITKGQWYTWSVGAYKGAGTTLVAEADSLPSSSGTKSGFRVPQYTTDTKTWTINMSILCPAGTVLTRNVRSFWAAWQEGQDLPQSFNWKNDSYSTSLNRSITITNRTDNDTLYLGLESDLMVTKPLYSSGTTTEPLELLPTGPWPWASNMDDQTKIYRTKAFNPYTNMSEWRRGLPNGAYSVPFAIPTPYDAQWCSTPTPTPICQPTIVSPNGTNITSIPPTLTWNACGAGGSYQISVNGGGIAWTSLALAQTSYTMNGFTFNPGSSYTWTVKKCADAGCSITGPASTGTFTYFTSCTEPPGCLCPVAGARACSMPWRAEYCACPVCFKATEDTYVQENAPTTNYGSSNQVRAGSIFTTSSSTTNTYYYLSYFKFDVSKFPELYNKATFRVHQSDSDGAAGGTTVNLHKITSSWAQGTATWNNKPTWDTASWGSQSIGGWNQNNVWYNYDITTYLKSTTILNGLVLAEYRYTPSCDGNYGAMCRAGASRAGYLDSAESGANGPEICFGPSGSSSSSVCAKTSGDANCDGQVNEADYTIWRCEYLGGGTCASPASTKTADFNSPPDGKVDLVDFEIWRSTYYANTRPPTPAPP